MYTVRVHIFEIYMYMCTSQRRRPCPTRVYVQLLYKGIIIHGTTTAPSCALK